MQLEDGKTVGFTILHRDRCIDTTSSKLCM